MAFSKLPVHPFLPRGLNPAGHVPAYFPAGQVAQETEVLLSEMRTCVYGSVVVRRDGHTSRATKQYDCPPLGWYRPVGHREQDNEPWFAE